MKEHAALIRVELKVFRLTNQLALERRRHAQASAKQDMIREVSPHLSLSRESLTATAAGTHGDDRESSR